MNELAAIAAIEDNMVIVIGSIVYDQSHSEYEITRFIDAGSFGNVYEARKKSDGTLWAVKTLQTPFADQTALKAFINEGNLAITISHQNVIKYLYFHDGSSLPGLPPHIIMELADGGTLLQLIESRRTNTHFLSNDELKQLFAQLIDGMEAINAKLVHRDIKPENILLASGTLKISDFGLSKIVAEATRTSSFKGIGCLPYMAPEAWRLEKNTILMDVYSMGIVFYELATLKHPLTVSKGDVRSWQDAHFFQNPARPDALNKSLPPIISQTIAKMIEKKSESRFQNWPEIRSFLSKDNAPIRSDSALVDKVLKKRIEVDEKAREQQLAIEKRNQELKDLKVMISYQFNNEIIEPIRTLLEEVNSKYAGTKNVITTASDSMTANIRTSSQRQITLEVRPIIKEDFYRERVRDDYGMQSRTRELRLPTYRGQPLLAWGCLKADDERGFNLLLLENQNSPYGTWHLLINRSRAIVGEQRIAPFPFDFDEIEKEIELVGAMHIYVSEGKALDIQFITEFIAEYI
jgi:serine/threonine protein kinase